MRYLYHSVCGLVLMYLILPVFVVIPLSFSASPYLEFPPRGFSLQWYQQFFGLRTWYGSMIFSAEVAFLTMVLATILGTAAALGLARAGFRGAEALQTVLIAPMIIPHIIIAIAIYGWYAQLHLIGTLWGLVLIYSVLAVPFVVITVTGALQGLDPNLEPAAMALGANRVQTFFRVVLPNIRPGILAGAILTFALAFDEIVIAIFISGTTGTTLPKRMWEGIRTEINPTIAAASTILITVSFVLFALLETLRRGLARGKR
ncbi:MAG: ABC transporter permease [Candidatus Rokubacteria bacterium]|nr:ABC transporter permease [Candidatus Rokubacteria bacterium]